jgi:pimeloyl-ACP methyl ester carboxylesterase
MLLLEGRSILELAFLLPASPLLRRAPMGDGHPVLVLPPFFGSDLATRVLRGFLRGRGYAVSGWGLGRNLGPTPEMVKGLVQRLEEIRGRHRRAVSLVGWSLGGVYARELARRHASHVRQVITLASPFRDVDAVNLPRFMRLFGNRRPHEGQAEIRAQMHLPPPVPTTAIYSRSDGIVAWRGCAESAGPLCENVEVESSHLGIGHHPAALLTIADRLAQPQDGWRPFRPPAGLWWPIAPRLGVRTPWDTESA